MHISVSLFCSLKIASPGDQIVERWRKIDEEKSTRSSQSERRALLYERLE